MRAGRILQIGTPREIYTAPADPFTAGFVGAMNLLPATAESEGTVRLLDKLPLAPRHEMPRGAKIIAAIRPEHVEFSNAPDTLAATLVSREFQGAFVRLSLAIAGLEQPLLVDVGNGAAVPDDGAAVAVRFPPEHVRLFAADAAR